MTASCTGSKINHEKTDNGNPGPAEQLTDVKERLITEGHGSVRTTHQLTDVKMKLIAEFVVSDLNLGWVSF